MSNPTDPESPLPYDALRPNHTFPPEVIAQIGRMADEGHYEIRGGWRQTGHAHV